MESILRRGHSADVQAHVSRARPKRRRNFRLTSAPPPQLLRQGQVPARRHRRGRQAIRQGSECKSFWPDSSNELTRFLGPSFLTETRSTASVRLGTRQSSRSTPFSARSTGTRSPHGRSLRRSSLTSTRTRAWRTLTPSSPKRTCSRRRPTTSTLTRTTRRLTGSTRRAGAR